MVNTDDLKKDYTSEERLMVAVLQQSLEDLGKKKYKQEAWRFFLDNKLEHGFSFINICQELNIDEEIIRTKVTDYYLRGKPMTRA